MISIIVCSRTAELRSDFKKNIEQTIGGEYELIVIDNSTNQYSIFEAYNRGIKKSKGEILCFLHDDIIFHTQNWGIYLNNCFDKNTKLGLLGVAGAKIKTSTPSAWWDCPEKFKVINIIQHKKGLKKLRNTGFQDESEEVEVAVIDGVFMAVRKANNLIFNKSLKGFHAYDLNISIENHTRGFEIAVTRKILLEHFSSGTLNQDWYRNTIEIHKLYKNALPINKAGISAKKLSNIEFNNGSRFIKDLYRSGNRKEAISIWKRSILLNPFSRIHPRLIKFFITN